MSTVITVFPMFYIRLLIGFAVVLFCTFLPLIRRSSFESVYFLIFDVLL